MGLLSSFKNTIKKSLASIDAGIPKISIDPALEKRIQSIGLNNILSNIKDPKSFGMNYSNHNITLSKPQTQAAASVTSQTKMRPVYQPTNTASESLAPISSVPLTTTSDITAPIYNSNADYPLIQNTNYSTEVKNDISSAPQKSALEKLMEQYLSSLQPTEEELTAQKQLNNIIAQQSALNASLNAGKENIAQQTIPMDFITGQQAGLERQAAARQQALSAQSIPLTQQLALLQAKRQGQQAAAKAGMEFAAPTYKDINSGSSLIKLDPLTGQYETVTQGVNTVNTAPVIKDINGVSSQWNPETGQWDAIQPSGVNTQASELKSSALKTAQDLLTKFQSGVKYPVGVSSLLPIFPGTESANFVVLLKNLTSLLSLDNIKYLKGQGQVSDAERKLLSEASAKLDRSQTEEEFAKSLQDIITALSGSGQQNTKQNIEEIDWANI